MATIIEKGMNKVDEYLTQIRQGDSSALDPLYVHAVEMERALLAGNFADIFPHLWWVLGYAIVSLAVAVLLFLRQMKK